MKGKNMLLWCMPFLILLSCTQKKIGDYPVKPVEFTKVKVTDGFWLSRMETNRRVTIPFAFEKCEKTGRIDNFAKAAGMMEGSFVGRRYNDSDVFKVMEGAAYSLSNHPDPTLEKYMDRLIEKIAGAQEEDGYLYTARTIDPANRPPGTGETRWSNLGSSHELYNVGHMYEAAVAYYRATGKRNFLDVSLKNADFINQTFGPDKRRGFPGHQEIEIGLVKLFRVTGNENYLKLAKFFLDERGKIIHQKKFSDESDFSIYNQDWYLQAHKPVVEQEEAVGHAVRAGYMYSAMADIAAMTGDKNYSEVINTLWKNVVTKKIYLTGGIGSRHEGEAFGENYELPDATAYNETCAAIANVFWNHRLFLLHGESKYIDILEKTLYNGLISGVSLEGDRFFYPNPLESDGEYEFNMGAATRQPWFSCACCPVNVCRFIASFPRYIYARENDNIFVNLFVNNVTTVKLENMSLTIQQYTSYPWEGNVRMKILPEEAEIFTVSIRIPGWARDEAIPGDLYSFIQENENRINITVNGEKINYDIRKGYAVIGREWKRGDEIEIYFPMEIRRVIAHNSVKADRGKVALQRGPVIYCFEGVDNNGHVLGRRIPDELTFEAEYQPGFLGGVTVLTSITDNKDKKMQAVPYHVWSHRGVGEMAVWMDRE